MNKSLEICKLKYPDFWCKWWVGECFGVCLPESTSARWLRASQTKMCGPKLGSMPLKCMFFRVSLFTKQFEVILLVFYWTWAQYKFIFSSFIYEHKKGVILEHNRCVIFIFVLHRQCLNIITWNINGCASHVKREKNISKVRKADITFLQGTHYKDEKEALKLRQDWVGHVLHNYTTLHQANGMEWPS